MTVHQALPQGGECLSTLIGLPDVASRRYTANASSLWYSRAMWWINGLTLGTMQAVTHLASASAGAILSAFVRVPTDTLKHRVQAYLIPDVWRVSCPITAYAGNMSATSHYTM